MMTSVLYDDVGLQWMSVYDDDTGSIAVISLISVILHQNSTMFISTSIDQSLSLKLNFPMYLLLYDDDDDNDDAARALFYLLSHNAV